MYYGHVVEIDPKRYGTGFIHGAHGYSLEIMIFAVAIPATFPSVIIKNLL